MRAYGIDLRIEVEDADPVGPVRLPWHPVSVLASVTSAPDRTAVEIGADRAVLDVAGRFRLQVERVPLQLFLSSPEPVTDAELVHPVAAFVGSAVARWTGRTAFHAASVVLAGGAWLLLAASGDGKSSTALGLDARGHTVLADDLSVLDTSGGGPVVLAGPRTCDLREESAARLAGGQTIGTVNGRPRWRAAMAPVPPEVPLRGFVELTWGERVAAERVDAGGRLAALARHDALHTGPVEDTSFLDLLGLPFHRLSRPHDWASFEATLDLLERVASTG